MKNIKIKKGKLSINRWNTFAVWSVCLRTIGDVESGVVVAVVVTSHRILIRRKTEYPRCSVLRIITIIIGHVEANGQNFMGQIW